MTTFIRQSPGCGNARSLNTHESQRPAYAGSIRRSISASRIQLSSSASTILPGERTLLIKRDLSPLDGNLVGRVDPDAHRVVVNLHDRNPNTFPDVKTLAKLPAQYQHDSLLPES
jgi:hypothetical protein